MARKLVVEIVGNASGLESALTRSSAAASGFASRMRSIGWQAQYAGRTLTMGLTAPLAAAGFEATRLSVEFEQAMEQIHTQAGASQAEVAGLSKAVLQLASTAPQGPVELAKGLFHLESLGLRGAKAMKTLRIASLAAGMGVADLEQTTTALGGAVVTGIRGTENYSRAMGVLNATIGAGNMRMNDLVGALSTGVLPAAKQVGLSLPQVGAALAVLTDRGVPAERAAYRLATGLSKLAAPSGPAKKALKDLGLTAQQIDAAMRSGPHGLLNALRLINDGMTKLGDKSRATADVLAAFGGARMGRAMLTLVQSLDTPLSSYQGKLAQITAKSGQFAKDVTAYQQTAAYKLHAAWSSVQAALVKVGGILAPIVTQAAQLLARLADAFSSLSPHTQRLILLFSGLAAAIGPVLLVAGGLATAIGTLATPFGAAVVGVGALSAAAAYFGATSPGFRAQLLGIADDVRSRWPEIKTIGLDVFDTLRQVVEGTVATVESVWARFGSIIVSQAKATFSFVLSTVRNAMEVLRGVIDLVSGLIHGDWSRVWKGISEIFDGTWKEIVAVARFQLTTFENQMRATWRTVTAVAQGIGHAIATGVESGLAKLEQLAHWLESEIGQGIAHAVSYVVSMAAALGRSLVDGAISGIKSMFGKFGSSIAGFFKSGISWGWHHIGSTGAEVMQGLGTQMGTSTIEGWILGTAALPSKMSTTLRNAIEKARQTISNLRSSLSTAFGSLQSDVLKVFDTMQSKLQTPTEKLLSGMVSQQDAQQFRANMAQAQQALTAALQAAGAAQPTADQLSQLADAQSKVSIAQDNLNAKIAKYGATSAQAAKATLSLHSAQAAVSKIEGQLPQQSSAVAAAFTRMQAAQQGLTNAITTYGAASKQAVDAQAALQSATANAAVAVSQENPTTDQAQRDAQVVSAQQQINSLLYQQQQTALQKRADLERTKLDATIAMREQKLTAALTQLETHLAKTGATEKQGQEAILKLLRGYGIKYKDAGNLLGDSFAQGLLNAESAVGKAAARVAAAAAARLQLHSPAKEGPLSTLGDWWKPLPDMLIGSLDTASVSAGIDRGLLAGIAQGAVARGAVNYNLTLDVHGSVQTERDLHKAVLTGIQEMQRLNGGDTILQGQYA